MEKQARLPKMPRTKKPNEFMLWQLAGDAENEILDRLNQEEYDEDYDDDADYAAYDVAHAATASAFAPIAPHVKEWWTAQKEGTRCQ